MSSLNIAAYTTLPPCVGGNLHNFTAVNTSGTIIILCTRCGYRK